MTAQPNAAARTVPQALASADAAEWFGLSHAQRAVWLDMRLIEDPAAYQVGCLVTFESAIDPDLARQAVRMMAGRHEALRLRIDRDEPRQRIEPAGRPPFRLIDLTEEADPQAAARAHVEAVHAAGFRLGDEPLFRVDLLKLADSRWQLMLLAHHLIADGVALGIAQAHWLNAYRTLAGEGDEDDGSGTEAVMPRSTYRSVVTDDEAYAASPRHAEDLAYWTARLSPLPGLVLEGVSPAARMTSPPKSPSRRCASAPRPMPRSRRRQRPPAPPHIARCSPSSPSRSPAASAATISRSAWRCTAARRRPATRSACWPASCRCAAASMRRRP